MIPYKINYPNLLDRKIAPPIHEINEFPIVEVERDQLSTGLRYYFVHSDVQPVCRIEWVVEAGMMYHQNPAVPFLISKMLVEGTRSYTGKQIQETIAGEGAFFEASVSADKVIYTLHAMNKSLPNLLKVMVEIFTSPTFPNDELENLKRISIQQLKINKEKTAFLASEAFRAHLYGKEHPMAISYQIEDIERVTPHDLTTFLSSFYTYFEVILSGCCDARAVKFLQEWSSEVELAPKGLPERDHSTSYQPQSFEMEKPTAVQTSIRFGYTTINRSHPDWHKLRVANELLGGFFGSRLMKNIREDKGWTYGVHSQIQSSVLGSFWVIGTDVKKEIADDCVNEISLEIEKLIQEPVEQTELQTVVNYMKGAFLGSLNTPFALADKFKTLYFSGLSYDYYQKYLSELNRITSFDVQNMASTYFRQSIVVKIG